jgi:DNA-binding beta-propeller fold protein YncE
VAADNQGNIYVVNDDPPRNLVQKFDSTGHYLGEFGSNHDPTRDSLYGLAIDAQGNIYVSDVAYRASSTAQSNVQKFHLK